jgi:hypothetical protein
VSWAACDIKYDDQVTGPLAPPKAKPEVWVSETVGGKYKAHKGHATSYIIDSTSSGGSIYRSPIFNHVRRHGGGMGDRRLLGGGAVGAGGWRGQARQRSTCK